MLARRSFLTGLFSALAAPAIVRAGSLMPVRNPPVALQQLSFEEVADLLRKRVDEAYAVMRQNMSTMLYDTCFVGEPAPGGLYDLLKDV